MVEDLRIFLVNLHFSHDIPEVAERRFTDYAVERACVRLAETIHGCWHSRHTYDVGCFQKEKVRSTGGTLTGDIEEFHDESP